ncbi:MAG: MATE family efflux transporter [Lachnospiraceae bacterium]|nr:MATE family efflux transporter [Lachnospiraceae bacterium]
MNDKTNFTQGRILLPLMRFALPVMFAMFLQAMYGAVDLFVVGKFATPEDVSAVSTGSMIMMTLANIMTSMAMGTTIYFGQQIGMGKTKKGGEIIGASIALFVTLGLVMSILIPIFSTGIASIMQAPADAFDKTVVYCRICGGGMIAIVAYNLIGAIFRGMGDSKTPLMAVGIACVANIVGDLVLIAGFGLGASGAAIATVGAQVISVLCSVLIVSRRKLGFEFHRRMIRFNKEIIGHVLRLGIPIALQDFLVGISFLVIQAIVNTLGVTASAGVGVSQKVCGFIMLVPAAFMQSISAFVAQNVGAGKMDRAYKALRGAIMVSFVFGISMFAVGFFKGSLLTGLFAKDQSVILAGAEYLKSYAIDCLFTCFLFCFIGFYNGCGNTSFVMLQGIIGAFAVRIPVCFLMSKWEPVTLFHIGLATPCSTVAQILLCFGFLFLLSRKRKSQGRFQENEPENP